MSNLISFAIFRGEDGAVILQKTQDISTVISQRKPARSGKPAHDACYLLLKNNNRIEVVGETVASVFDKLESAFGYRPALFGELAAEPQAEKETDDA